MYSKGNKRGKGEVREVVAKMRWRTVKGFPEKTTKRTGPKYWPHPAIEYK